MCSAVGLMVVLIAACALLLARPLRDVAEEWPGAFRAAVCSAKQQHSRQLCSSSERVAACVRRLFIRSAECSVRAFDSMAA